MCNLLGEVLFLLGPPLGTGCSIDKPKGTQISLHTKSVYLGSSESTGGTGSRSWHRAPSPVWWGGQSGAHMLVVLTRTHIYMHDSRRVAPLPLSHMLITEYACVPVHINVHLHLQLCSTLPGGPRFETPMLTLTSPP